ncbi:MAG TPA: CHAD domain-containing protein [Candidatus Acidoferrum sp.]|jgi:CHAD domain-containing protein
MAIAEDRISKPVRKLRKLLKKPRSRPTTKQIHDLRTNSRRFQSALEAFGLESSGNEKHLLPDLARVRKQSGKIRDMDVLTGYALNTNISGEQDCLVQLIEHLGARRAKQARKLKALVSAVGPRLRRRLKRTASKFEELLKRHSSKQEESRPQPSDEAMAKAFRLASELRRPSQLSPANLHPYRLRVKELQYLLQLAEDSKQQAFVAALKKVKDAIGAWHDWQVLVTIAEELLDHRPQCKLIAKLHSLSDAKYTHAISLANHLRHDFVAGKSPGKRSRRRGAPQLVKPPVLAATSALSA